MRETHFAYEINHTALGLAQTHSELREDKMVDLLKKIEALHSKGIFWVFKQFADLPLERLCIVDCESHRIYYHYSGDVEDLKEAIKRLSH